MIEFFIKYQFIIGYFVGIITLRVFQLMGKKEIKNETR